MNLVVVTSHIFPQVSKVTYFGLLPLLPRGNKAYLPVSIDPVQVYRTRCYQGVQTCLYGCYLSVLTGLYGCYLGVQSCIRVFLTVYSECVHMYDRSSIDL